jgi:hypothetical protein
MSWVAVAVGGSVLVGGYAQYQGSKAAGQAAQAGAEAQAGQAAATRADVLRESGRLERQALPLADATPDELAALDRSKGSALASLDREERLLAAVDPSLMEASKQALALLRGGTAEANKPLMNLRAQQRQNLLNSLRAQYGPGAESSSIGQKALRQFDMESDSLFQTNQQNSLSQMFGIATTDLGSRQQRAISGLEQVGQGYSAIQDRKLNARLNVGATSLGALSGTSQAMIQSAGAPYVGAALQGQAQAAFGGNIANTGATLGAAYLIGGGTFGKKT